jgi:hypothetical protein
MHRGVRLHGQNACYVIFWNIAPKHWIYMDTGYCNSFYFFLQIRESWVYQRQVIRSRKRKKNRQPIVQREKDKRSNNYVEINLTRKTVIQEVCQVELHLFVVFYFITIPRQNYHRVTQRVPHMEQKLLTLPKHLDSPPVFSEVRVARTLVFCMMFLYSYLTFCPFLMVYIVLLELETISNKRSLEMVCF